MSTAIASRSGVAAYAPADLVRADRLATTVFLHVNFIFCICLQRFCFYAGASPIYWCLPVFLGSLLWLLATGRATVRLSSAGLYGLLVVATIFSALLAINQPDPRIAGLSVMSLFALLALYAGLVFKPTERFDTSQTLTVFVHYVRLCAVLGIAQYLAQFAGVRLFSFLVSVPALRPILVEPLFNYWPIVAYGSSILRSNGFFLVEPSTFSQLLALGMVADVFVRRVWRYLPLYGAAYLLSYAGTGALALAIACTLLVVLAPRQAGRLLGFAVVGLVLAVAGSLVFPEQFASLTGRAGEIGYSGSSGYARYMTQFDVLSAIANETRMLIGYGPGALERADFYTSGGGNPAIKLLVDYGIIGLLVFAVFFITTLWRRSLALVALFVMVNFQLGGGNLMFAPLVVLGAIVCIWASATRRGAPSDGDPA